MTITTQNNVPLSNLCSFKLSETLNTLFIVNTIEELQYIKKKYKKVFVLGKGSNTLINPNHTYDAIIKLSPNITDIKCTGTNLTVPASTSVNKLMTLSKQYGLSG